MDNDKAVTNNTNKMMLVRKWSITQVLVETFAKKAFSNKTDYKVKVY